MHTLAQMVIVKGIFLFILGAVLAAHACDPDTWLTVNPAMMELGAILSVTGIFAGFGGLLVFES